MDIFINERSFNNQAQPHNVHTAMQQLADTVQLLRTICAGAEVVIHSSFSSRKLCNNQTVAAWLSTEQDDDEEQDEDSSQPPRQAIIGIVLSAFARGPFVEDMLAEHEHACYLNEEDHELSAVAAAACLDGVVVSLEGHPGYPDGMVTAQLGRRGDKDFADVGVPHFVSVAEARKCRRRYVPNKKHHPDSAKGSIAPMECDREYDLFTPDQEAYLRHAESDMPDTQCQRLLDSALPGGKQLYALVYAPNGRSVTFYEFQPDNMNGFHGYRVSEAEIPSEVVRALREQARSRA